MELLCGKHTVTLQTVCRILQAGRLVFDAPRLE